MPLERVQYNLSHSPSLTAGLLVGGGLGWFLSWLMEGNIFIATVLFGGIGFIVQASRSGEAKIKAFKETLKAHNFSCDYFRHNFAIDKGARKIAFDQRNNCIDCYAFSDILHFSHQWTERTSNGRIENIKNRLRFEMKNPEKPIYEISFLTYNSAEEWLARINALLHS